MILWLKLLWGKKKNLHLNYFFCCSVFLNISFHKHYNANSITERWGVSAARQVDSVMLFSCGDAGYKTSEPNRCLTSTHGVSGHCRASCGATGTCQSESAAENVVLSLMSCWE